MMQLDYTYINLTKCPLAVPLDSAFPTHVLSLSKARRICLQMHLPTIGQEIFLPLNPYLLTT